MVHKVVTVYLSIIMKNNLSNTFNIIYLKFINEDSYENLWLSCLWKIYDI